ncbi:MAG: hypothetical protein AB7V37_12945 [Eubacteriaceae bacterium]
MFIYLTSEKNNTIFDFLEDSSGQSVKKFIGDFNFLDFVSNHLMSYDSCRYLAVDLECIDDYPESLYEAIDMIRQYFNYQLRIIIVSFDLDPDIRENLSRRNIFNIVEGGLKDDVQQLITRIFSGDGIQNDLNPSEIIVTTTSKSDDVTISSDFNPSVFEPISETVIRNNTEQVFKEKIICIAGCQRRTGTTTTGFQLANYIASKGKTVAYLEGNDHGHLSDIAKSYQMQKISNGIWQMNGVDYMLSDSEFFKHYHYIIIDLGELNDDSLSFYKDCDIRVLCGDAKCYEKRHISDAILRLVTANIQDYHLFLHFVAPNELLLLKSQYEDAYYFETTAQLFAWTMNQNLFKRLLTNRERN